MIEAEIDAAARAIHAKHWEVESFLADNTDGYYAAAGPNWRDCIQCRTFAELAVAAVEPMIVDRIRASVQ